MSEAPELLAERQREILSVARAQGEVLVEPLAEAFNVTPQTIRRDLKQLCEMRLLQRVHGGAKLPDGVANMGYEARRRLMVEEKNSIASSTAALIPDDSSLFVNIGTTTESVARALARHRGLLVITNNINVIHILRGARLNQLIIAGGSAYPREIDFQAFRDIADEVGAYLLVDMAHFAGLAAGGAYPNPVPFADVCSTTTHKTLRGPRGGMILSRDADLGKKFNSAVFPGMQGGPLMHVIAAKAVAFGEALRPEFKAYAASVVEN